MYFKMLSITRGVVGFDSDLARRRDDRNTTGAHNRRRETLLKALIPGPDVHWLKSTIHWDNEPFANNGWTWSISGVRWPSWLISS
jgi:hypothetical protein